MFLYQHPPPIISREGHRSFGGGSSMSSTGTKDNTVWKLVQNGRSMYNLSVKTNNSNTAHQCFFPTEFNDSADNMEKVGLHKEEKWTVEDLIEEFSDSKKMIIRMSRQGLEANGIYIAMEAMLEPEDDNDDTNNILDVEDDHDDHDE
eukprot:2333976-Ditylum_brightwellii.AAC.1